MKFDKAMLLVAMMLVGSGLVSFLITKPPPANIDLESLGVPQPEQLKRLCVLYEAAKQDLVKLNLSLNATIGTFQRIVSCGNIATGLVFFMLRTVRDLTAQKQILRAVLAASTITFSFTVYTVLNQQLRIQEWIPLSFQLAVIGLLSSSLVRVQRAKV